MGIYATWGIARRLCEFTELSEGCVSVKSRKNRSKETATYYYGSEAL